MTSFAGLRVVSVAAALLAGGSVARAQGTCVNGSKDSRPSCGQDGQPSSPMSSVAFDAIFYRAASGLGNCYVENGFAGYSLRPLPTERLSNGDLRGIHHTVSQTCGDCSSNTTAGSEQSAALADCTGQCCHADCTAFAHKSQRTSTTSDALRTVEKPGPCSSYDCSSGLTCVAFTADTSRNLTNDKARLRPGDDCESASHTALLVSRVSGDNWKTWEARGQAYGVVPHQRNVDTDLLRGNNSDPTCPVNTRGCWRPVTERTSAPTNIALFVAGTGGAADRKLLPADTISSDDANALVLKWEPPAHFAALANYLVWIQWTDNGQTEHRVFRVPAFSQRWQPPETRLVDFPNATGVTTVNGAQVSVPLDESETNVLRVPLDRVTSFFQPQEFKDADNHAAPTDAFASGLVPCAPTLPALVSAEAACGNQAFTAQETSWSAILAQAVPRTYSVQIRVERYGDTDDDATHFNQRTLVGACPKINNDFDPDCLDPQWSAAQTFTVGGLKTQPVSGGCFDQMTSSSHLAGLQFNSVPDATVYCVTASGWAGGDLTNFPLGCPPPVNQSDGGVASDTICGPTSLFTPGDAGQLAYALVSCGGAGCSVAPNNKSYCGGGGCFSGMTVTGTAFFCNFAGMECGTPANCCSPLTCLGGRCQSPNACVASGQPCGAQNGCAPGGETSCETCCNGFCLESGVCN